MLDCVSKTWPPFSIVFSIFLTIWRLFYYLFVPLHSCQRYQTIDQNQAQQTGLLGKRIGEASNPGPIKAKKRQAPNSAELQSQGPSAWHNPNHPSYTLPNANAASPAQKLNDEVVANQLLITGLIFNATLGYPGEGPVSGCACSKNSSCKTNACSCHAAGEDCSIYCKCKDTKCTNRKYCLCRKTIDEDSTAMVNCDECQLWFHIACFPQFDVNLRTWRCDVCKANQTQSAEFKNQLMSWAFVARRHPPRSLLLLEFARRSRSRTRGSSVRSARSITYRLVGSARLPPVHHRLVLHARDQDAFF